MKEIKAIIDPGILSKVISALHAVPHFPGITVSDANGQGRGEGPGGRFVAPISWAFSKKVKLEIFCADSACDELVAVIASAAHEGEASHGVIVVVDIGRAVRVRTGQEQDEAL